MIIILNLNSVESTEKCFPFKYKVIAAIKQTHFIGILFDVIMKL